VQQKVARNEDNTVVNSISRKPQLKSSNFVLKTIFPNQFQASRLHKTLPNSQKLQQIFFPNSQIFFQDSHQLPHKKRLSFHPIDLFPISFFLPKDLILPQPSRVKIRNRKSEIHVYKNRKPVSSRFYTKKASILDLTKYKEKYYPAASEERS
jgi:hypothetical protein